MRCSTEQFIGLWFGLHVAGLTEPDEVRSGIRRFGCIEVPVGEDVVDGQRWADELSALAATTTLLGDDDRSYLFPASASVGLLAALPVSSISPAAVHLPVAVFARPAAELADAANAASVLPRLHRERSTTLQTGAFDRWNPFTVCLPTTDRGTGIGRGRGANIVHALDYRFALARVRAKSWCHPGSGVGGDIRGQAVKSSPAYDTGKFDTFNRAAHLTSLPPYAGTGTVGVVATGHGRDAVLIDLDAKNAILAEERLGMFLTIKESAA